LTEFVVLMFRKEKHRRKKSPTSQNLKLTMRRKMR